VEPRWQAASYGPFLYANGRVTEEQVLQANETYTEYLELLDAHHWKKAGKLDDQMLDTLGAEAVPPVNNYFDIRYVLVE
jgi:hypothetical protein